MLAVAMSDTATPDAVMWAAEREGSMVHLPVVDSTAAAASTVVAEATVAGIAKRYRAGVETAGSAKLPAVFFRRCDRCTHTCILARMSGRNTVAVVK